MPEKRPEKIFTELTKCYKTPLLIKRNFLFILVMIIMAWMIITESSRVNQEKKIRGMEKEISRLEMTLVVSAQEFLKHEHNRRRGGEKMLKKRSITAESNDYIEKDLKRRKFIYSIISQADKITFERLLNLSKIDRPTLTLDLLWLRKNNKIILTPEVYSVVPTSGRKVWERRI